MAKQTIIRSIEAVITDTTEQDLEIPGREGNFQYCFDRLTLLDVNNSPTTVQIGLKAGSSETILDGKAEPGANVPFSVQGKIFAPSTYRPFARFTGASSGDVVKFFVYGYITDLVE